MKLVHVLMSTALAIAAVTPAASATPGPAVPVPAPVPVLVPESWEARTAASPRAQFIGCSSDQQNVVVAAASAATASIAEADGYLDGTSGATPRYTTWFGQYDGQRKALVGSVFDNLATNDLQSMSYDCSSCVDPGLYAYVYPDQFGMFQLCPGFWKAPATGTDSQAGALIHEASHFLVNGGTQDHAAGQDDCRELAIAHPGDAITNADSYEYFAENDPPLA